MSIDCIDVGVEASDGSVVTHTPATVPMAAARPHPSISIAPTGMPTSRLDSGFDATARMARPTWSSGTAVERTPPIASNDEHADLPPR